MSFEHAPEGESVVARTDRPPSEAVVAAVADAAGVGPLELPSLYAAVDPDALDALFERRAPAALTFRYHDYAVTVRGDGEVVLEEATPAT